MYQRPPTTEEDEKRKMDLAHRLAKEIMQFDTVERHDVFTNLTEILEKAHLDTINQAREDLDHKSKYLEHIKSLTFSQKTYPNRTV